MANTNVLDFATGYLRDGGAWDTDIRTPTRLNDDPQQTLRLARVRGDQVVPYALDALARRALAAHGDSVK